MLVRWVVAAAKDKSIASLTAVLGEPSSTRGSRFETCESCETCESLEVFEVCEVCEVFDVSPGVRCPNRVESSRVESNRTERHRAESSATGLAPTKVRVRVRLRGAGGKGARGRAPGSGREVRLERLAEGGVGAPVRSAWCGVVW